MEQEQHPSSDKGALTPSTANEELLLKSAADLINRLSPMLLISVAAAYFIGFLVVNAYLFAYGMVPYDFLQPRYVSAGFLYLVSTLGLTSIFLLLRHIVLQYHYPTDRVTGEIKFSWVILIVYSASVSILPWLVPKSESFEWWEQYFARSCILLALFTASINTFGLLPSRFDRFSQWWRTNILESCRLSWIVFVLMTLHVTATFGLSTFVFYPTFLLALYLVSQAYPFKGSKETSLLWKVYGLLYGIVLLGLSIYGYGVGTYPLVSPQIGGGKPLLVSLSLRPEHRSTLGRVLGREDSKCIMHNISVIHENTEMIYVLPNGYMANQAAIAIPKGELLSISYQRTKKNENSTCVER